MRLRARVRNVTGATRHYRAHIAQSEVIRDELMPAPEWVEIRPADGAFYLLYFSEAGDCLTDTWHQTLAQAKAQAAFEFAIEDADWEQLSEMS